LGGERNGATRQRKRKEGFQYRKASRQRGGGTKKLFKFGRKSAPQGRDKPNIYKGEKTMGKPEQEEGHFPVQTTNIHDRGAFQGGKKEVNRRRGAELGGGGDSKRVFQKGMKKGEVGEKKGQWEARCYTPFYVRS